MSQETVPTISNKGLIKALGIALFIAIIALITMIFPAEYNIDPLGAGKALGLTQLSEEANSSSVVKSKESEKTTTSGFQNDETIIEVPAGKGLEYKFYLEQYKSLTYSWKTDGSEIYFDMHGEPKDDTSGYFESYVIATASESEGTITTPFAGTHGWYFKNNSNQPIKITLITQGVYQTKGFVN